MTGSIRRMTDSDIDFVRESRNAPEVRKNMYTDHEISLEEHLRWFSDTIRDDTKIYLIYEEDNQPSGVINFSKINYAQRTAEWGFYAGIGAKKGIGTRMEFAALKYAFGELGLRKLNCEVLEFNEAVIALHRRFGFRLEGIRARHYLRGSVEHDIYLLGMTQREWNSHLLEHAATALVARDSSTTNVGKGLITKLVVTPEKIKNFADYSGDYNPLHFSDKDAKNAGFEGVIAHGAILTGEVSRILGMDFPGSGTIILKQMYQYRKPIYPDKEYELHLRCISKIGRLSIINVRLVSESSEVVATGEIEVISRSLKFDQI